MKKLFAVFIVFLVIVSGLSLNSVFAKNDKDADIPETDGVYDVPGHPEMKVRVFVHKIKPGKPSPEPVLTCGLADPNFSADVAWAGWKLPSSWTYNLNITSVPAAVGGTNLPAMTAAVFGEFIGAINNQVSVNRGLDTSRTSKALDGQNIITWGRASASALAVTYIWYYSSTGEVVELDTIMNKKYAWDWSEQENCAYIGVYDAQNILTHEIGHWFGLNDHYTTDYVDATMYGYGAKTEVKKNTLTTGDVSGLQAIY